MKNTSTLQGRMSYAFLNEKIYLNYKNKINE